jgi:2,4-dienoyl-CoA reductase-like NADH-dependent reductase (Old Yellow Enzyme family)
LLKLSSDEYSDLNQYNVEFYHQRAKDAAGHLTFGEGTLITPRGLNGGNCLESSLSRQRRGRTP